MRIAVAFEHLIVLGRGNLGITQSSLEVAHLPLNGQHVVERFTGFFEKRAATVDEAILWEIPDGQTARSRDHARVRLVESSHHTQQRCLAGAVRTA